MSIPKSLVVVNGALAMDGGSVFLEALDEHSRLRTIMLDWSITAKREGKTALLIDERLVAKQTAEEDTWVAAIASAAIRAASTFAGGEAISASRVILASDAAAILAAGETGANAGLAALRDSLVAKIRSTVHNQKRA